MTEPDAYRKPLPKPNRLSAPFWEGAKQRELRLQRCDDCGTHRFPPSNRCPGCLSTNTTWVRASGRGRIWSWIEMWQRYFPAFEADLPYTVAYVELEEGPRLMTNVVDPPAEGLRCDLPVEVVFDDVTDEITLPKFRPC